MNSLLKFFTGTTSGQFTLLSYSGESMLPKYKTGDILKLIQINNHNVILWGESYLIVTGFSPASFYDIRNIFPHPDENMIILRSANREIYEDIVISKSEILYLFIVKGKLEITQL